MSRATNLSQRDLNRQAAIDDVLQRAVDPAGALLLARAEQEAARRRLALPDGPVGFVYRYCRIIDPDTGLRIPFHLWPLQARALLTMHRNRLSILLKARQLGLTWLALAYAALILLTRPGVTVVAMSRGEAEAKEMLWRFRMILEGLPKWITREIGEMDGHWPGPVWDCGVLRCDIRHPDGLVSRLMGEQAAPNSGRSFTASMVILDEWAFQDYAREIWKAAYPTINRPAGGKVIGISTAEPGTLFQDIWEDAEAGKNGFVPIFLPWNADPSRNDAWYQRTLNDIGPHAMATEYPSNPSECWSQGARKSFPEFKHDTHTVEPRIVPPDWPRVRGYDHGFVHPACVLWAAVDDNGHIWVYRELYKKQMQVRDIAAEIRRLETFAGDPTKETDGSGSPCPDRIAASIADYQIFEKAQTAGPSVSEEFEQSGIVWDRADKSREAGWNELHSRFGLDEHGKPRIHIFRSCEHLIREIIRARTNKAGTDDVDTLRCSDHALDALRYILMSRPVPRRQEVKGLSLWQEQRRRHRKAGESWMAW